jgi:hypothetical protein
MCRKFKHDAINCISFVLALTSYVHTLTFNTVCTGVRYTAYLIRDHYE